LLYTKTFKANDSEKTKTVMSVVVNVGGVRVSISTHRRDQRDILKAIKKADDVVYEKPQNTSQTDGNDTRYLANSVDDSRSALKLNEEYHSVNDYLAAGCGYQQA
jgi:hypothetical protein